MSEGFLQALDAEPERHARYSRFSPIRSLTPEQHYSRLVRPGLIEVMGRPAADLTAISSLDRPHWFLSERLEWDTEFFGLPVHRLHAVAAPEATPESFAAAAAGFRDRFREAVPGGYCFTEVPSEDIHLLQALTSAGFRLIETRLTYLWNDLTTHAHPRRSVRQATAADVANLRRVAAETRNPFDRFHADPALPEGTADRFLARYVEESIAGYADLVLVPDEPGSPADAFNTADLERGTWPILGENVARIVLSAVAPSNRGWYPFLISETLYRVRDEGATKLLATTQSTNGAVLHTWFTLGAEVGAVRHILALA